MGLDLFLAGGPPFAAKCFYYRTTAFLISSDPYLLNEAPMNTSALKHLGALSILLLSFFGATVAQRDMNTIGKADKLSESIRSHQIMRLEILHVPDDLDTDVAITPDTLRRFSRYKVVIEDPVTCPPRTKPAEMRLLP